MLSFVCTRLAVPFVLGATSLFGYGLAHWSYPPPGSEDPANVEEVAEIDKVAEIDEVAEIEEVPDIEEPADFNEELADDRSELDSMLADTIDVDDEALAEESEMDDDAMLAEADQAQEMSKLAWQESYLNNARERLAAQKSFDRKLELLLTQHAKAEGDAKNEIRMQVENLVTEMFQQKLAAQKARVEKLLAEIEQVQAQLSRREELGQQIIAKRVQELLGEKDELSWDDDVSLPSADRAYRAAWQAVKQPSPLAETQGRRDLLRLLQESQRAQENAKVLQNQLLEDQVANVRKRDEYEAARKEYEAKMMEAAEKAKLAEKQGKLKSRSRESRGK